MMRCGEVADLLRLHKPTGATEYGVWWAGSVAGVAALRHATDADFARYFGDVPPMIAVGVVGAAGVAALRALTSQGWMVAEGTSSFRGGAGPSAGVAALFGGAIVIADWLGGFPPDINVGWPQALLFYPAIGFVAEVVFHLVPLPVVVAILRRLPVEKPRHVVALSIAVVAAVEAAFQVLTLGSGGRSRWLAPYLGLHLFGFGVAQLAVLRRYGYTSTALMRLVYYAVWHIVWGRLRLDVLFPSPVR